MNEGSFEHLRKMAVFDTIDAATIEDDYDEENDEIASFLKSTKVHNDHSSQPALPEHINLNQSFGLHLELTTSSPPIVNQSGVTPVGPHSEEPQGKRGRKRKRPEDVALPDALQIFRGLVFYFFPNDDVAPARKARIRKAVERGVVWEKNFNESISHVIVDQGLTYGDLLKYLKVAVLPDDVIVVNEKYPSSCVALNQLLEPNPLQHRVKGQPRDRVVRKSCVDSKLLLGPSSNDSKAQTPVRSVKEDRVEATQNLDILTKAQAKSFQHTAQVVDSTSYSLDEAIKDAHAVQDLPLDSDDDEDPGKPDLMSIQSSPRSSTADGETEELPDSVPTWQRSFSCMKSSIATTSNPNARTIEVLQQMATHYDRVNDHWRTTAYRKAISVLKRQSTRITTKTEALAMPGIGNSLADKIEEIVQNDNLRFLQNAAEDPLIKALKTFHGIYGVGSIQASAWISQGFRTLEDLVTNRVDLTPNQRIGLEHHDHFNQRIQRKEMNRHAETVKEIVAKVENEIEAIIGGSYRRGSQDSGDIDFIITSPKTMSFSTLRTVFFETIIPHLYAASYLKCTLAASSARSDSSSKWHGACALPSSSDNPDPPWRRIDFLLVPYEELGAAMIYFIGNDLFNRSMRLLARKKGMRLNQRGLWKGVEGGPRRKGGEGGKGGTLVEARNEREIFNALGVQWREATERNV